MVKIVKEDCSTPVNITGKEADDKYIVKEKCSDREAARLVWIRITFPAP